jgi:hypothetical protein
MVNPQKLSGSHTLFLSGNDEGAKKAVRDLLESFGWRDILDLGDIGTARERLPDFTWRISIQTSPFSPWYRRPVAFGEMINPSSYRGT